jgi:hypothetical protein
MAINVLQPQEVRHIAQTAWCENLDTEISVAEALRAELWARKTCSRRTLCQRAFESIAPVLNVELDCIKRVLKQLDQIGDVIVGDEGCLASAPLRVIRMSSGRFLLVGGPESSKLALLLGCDVVASKLIRETTPADVETMLAAAANLGAITLSPERWSGLDRTPEANAEWIATQDQLLLDNPKFAIALPSTANEWQYYLSAPRDRRTKSGWRQPEGAESAQLWRLKQENGYWFYAWTSGSHPSAGGHIRLLENEAMRTRFALDRAAHASPMCKSTEQSGDIVLVIGTRIPRQEYRYLLTLGKLLDAAEYSYIFPKSEWTNVVSTLEKRLGLIISNPEITRE